MFTLMVSVIVGQFFDYRINDYRYRYKVYFTNFHNETACNLAEFRIKKITHNQVKTSCTPKG